MATPIQCPECDARMKVADDVFGKKVRCKARQAVFRAESSDVEVVEDEPPARKTRSGKSGRPARKKAPPKKSNMPLLIGAGVVAVLLLGGGLAAYAVFGRSKSTEAGAGAGGSSGPALTAEQRKIIGKWRSTSGVRQVIEFKANGEMVMMFEEGGQLKPLDDLRHTFRFAGDKTIVQSISGQEMFTYTIISMTDNHLSTSPGLGIMSHDSHPTR